MAESGAGVRVFISKHCGNQKIATEQSRVVAVLESRGVPCTTLDISAPGAQHLREFMRARGRRKEGQRHPLPPQIFNGEQFRGDFEDFDTANEDDELEEFLGLARRFPKVEAVRTGAVAPEAARRVVGRLPRAGREGEEGEAARMSCATNQLRKKSFAVEASCEEPCDEVEELASMDAHLPVTVEATIGDWKDLKISRVRISFARFVEEERAETSSEEETDSEEDSGPEFLEDGERRRKTTKGFKLLTNCKRFWKASQMKPVH